MFEKIRFHNDFIFLFDIISFVNWNRHRDKEDDNLTSVRTLSGRREVLVLASIVIWTLAFGFRSCYISDRLPADFLDGNLNTEVPIRFFDAFVSAHGVVNGVFIWLRFREQ